MALPTEVTSPVRLALVTTVAALPTEVTPPVKLALVVTVPAVNPAAVPVMFVPTKADGVPRAGVTSVGLVAKTAEPVPVSSVRAVARSEELNDPRDVALPTEVTAPVKLALVTTVVAEPAVRPAAVPVMFVPTSVDGVPRFGVTSVGLVANTAEPVPVSSVRAVAKLEELNDPKDAVFPTEVTIPVKLALVTTVVAFPTEVTMPIKLALVRADPAVRPVAVPVMFVPISADGVPKSGVTKVGLFDRTTEPVPVEDVTPVPPLSTGNVPLTCVAKPILP